jgi:hypothetical protein
MQNEPRSYVDATLLTIALVDVDISGFVFPLDLIKLAALAHLQRNCQKPVGSHGKGAACQGAMVRDNGCRNVPWDAVARGLLPPPSGNVENENGKKKGKRLYKLQKKAKGAVLVVCQCD